MTEHKLIRGLAQLTFGLSLLAFLLIGCTPAAELSGNKVEATLMTPEATKVRLKTPIIETTATSRPLHLFTPVITPTPQATVKDVPTTIPTIAATPPMPTATVAHPDLQGDLFVFRSQNPFDRSDVGFIIRVSLEDGERSYLLWQEETWQTLHVSFSPDGILATYWIETDNRSELWLTSLDPWKPELILSLPETGYGLVGSNGLVGIDWLVGHHYLLIVLSYDYFHSGVEKSFLIDTKSKQVESVPGWKGDCSTVAFSPRTNRLSTWCPMPDEQDSSLTYAVLEESGELWFSEQPPLNPMPVYPVGWSVDRRYVVFSEWSWANGLHYVDANTGVTRILTDKNSTSYNPASISPNNQYLYYQGKCNNGSYCGLMMDVGTEEIVWTSQLVDDGGAVSLYWSPDSLYFAVPSSDDSKHFYFSFIILIIDVTTGKVVLQIDDLYVGSMVWVQNR